MHKLWKEGSAVEAGISLVPALKISQESEDDVNAFFKDTVFGYREMKNEQINRFFGYKTNYK